MKVVSGYFDHTLRRPPVDLPGQLVVGLGWAVLALIGVVCVLAVLIVGGVVLHALSAVLGGLW